MGQPEDMQNLCCRGGRFDECDVEATASEGLDCNARSTIFELAEMMNVSSARV